MATIVLVHGAWQGEWVWEVVSAGLRTHGHEVLTVELPGSGKDQTPVEQVSLGLYVERINEAIQLAPSPVYLVGHSMGGIAVSQAAELAFEKITRLIYLCAFLPCDGDSLMSLTGLVASDQPMPLEFEEHQLSARFAAHAVIPAFMHDVDASVASWAAPQFKAQALAPLGTPVQLTSAQYGSVPRDYVLCHQDHAITPQLQKLMIQRAPCAQVYELDSSHCPFLSVPWQLVQLLDNIVSVKP